MSALAVIWIFWGYLIYFVGISLGLPSPFFLSIAFLLFFFVSVLYLVKAGTISKVRSEISILWASGIFERLLLIICLTQLLLNILGALSPELSFDALWYHLTLPKLYLLTGRIEIIPGGLLFSGVPRLTDMWYTAALAFDRTGTAAHFLHLFTGLFVGGLIYSFSRYFTDRRTSLLFSTIWWTMLVNSWLATTAYIDLYAVFFFLLATERIIRSEITAYSIRSLILISLFLGCLAATKVIYTLPVLITLLIVFRRRSNWSTSGFFALSFPVLATLLPWFLVAYFVTGDPIYPIFAHSPGSLGGIIPILGDRMLTFPVALWSWTFHPDTPISPVFLLFLPLVVLKFKRMTPTIKLMTLLVILFAVTNYIWTDFSNRYVLPSLALLTVICAWVYRQLNRQWQYLINFFCLLTVSLNLASRMLVSRKFVAYLSGIQSKEEYLLKNLNFAVGDFYDPRGEIRTIVGSRKVLVDGYHNLFYGDFLFDHVTWAQSPQQYRYILIGPQTDASKYSYFRLIFQDARIRGQLYYNPAGFL